MLNKNYVILLLILAASSIAWYGSHINHDTNSTVDIVNNLAQDEDFYAHNIRTLQFNKDGNIYYRSDAANAVHYKHAGYAQLNKPRIILLAKNDVTWIASANQGRAADHQAFVDLIDAVNISKFTHEQQTATFTLATDKITAYPHTDEIKTDSHVVMQTDTLTTDAIGLHANLNDNSIELLGNVKTHYENP